VDGCPDEGYYDTRLTGHWPAQTKVEVTMLKAARHWGRKNSVVNDPLGEQGRNPLYVGLSSAWGSMDGDRMYSPFVVGGLPNWGL